MVSMRLRPLSRRLPSLTAFPRGFRPGRPPLIPLSFNASLKQAVPWPLPARHQPAFGRRAGRPRSAAPWHRQRRAVWGSCHLCRARSGPRPPLFDPRPLRPAACLEAGCIEQDRLVPGVPGVPGGRASHDPGEAPVSVASLAPMALSRSPPAHPTGVGGRCRPACLRRVTAPQALAGNEDHAARNARPSRFARKPLPGNGIVDAGPAMDFRGRTASGAPSGHRPARQDRASIRSPCGPESRQRPEIRPGRQRDPPRSLARFIRPACAHGSSPVPHIM